MPNWHDVLAEFQQHEAKHATLAAQTADVVRRKYLAELAATTGRNVIAYYSGFLTKPNVHGTEIADDDMNALMSCIHGLDRDIGLDLILHTPGGGIAATEAISGYLHRMFGRNIRAIVPQIAMSAGTMLALSCSSVIMGKQSSLGPIDPQIGGLPADVVLKEFRRAFDEISAEPLKAHVWAPILSRYSPSFLTQCEHAVQWSRRFVQEALIRNMIADRQDAVFHAERIVAALSSAERNGAHDKHLSIAELADLGVSVVQLEEDAALQDAVLTVHHCFMHTLASTSSIKIVENHLGKANVRHVVQQVPQGMMIQQQPS
ncbi:Serine dehydrogenase proteinase [[Luteovulum] sphaeroides subsp. megalophilum]|uniref:SDH family Clp fold serine proteinase n=1 Tax=Cereibacter sphaeroides TaxID=1063 RepID=UPI000B6A8AED|nr:hypothetical protein [Cereibacter sphaeroides]SNS87070.1 Serine dehydrogenase proteinase [[Luteovulum] sphaeroides subsp. megalophilum]